jgi:DNA-directed RNA polymerase subunit RPC12/RpoP
MGKLIREVEEVKDETETVQVQVNEPIRTSQKDGPVSMDKVQLKCSNCDKVTAFTRRVETNLNCPYCGSTAFFSLSEFRMESPDGSVAISPQDKVIRRPGVWKLV